jgi:hypothetical protein
VLEEGRPHSLQKRFRQLGGDSDNLLVLPRSNLRIDDPAQWRAFAAGVKDERFDIVIADPLADLHELEESDGPAMRRLINQFKTLIVDTGAAVVLVHHTVKSSWGGANRDRPAAMLSDARGAGGQMGSADLAIALVRGGKTEDPNVRTADIYTTKDKDNVVPGAFPEAPSHLLTMTWDSENRTASVRLEDAAPLRLERRQAKAQRERDTTAQAQLFVRQALLTQPLSRTSLVRLARAERVNGFPAAVDRELLGLERAGQVGRIRGPKAGTTLFVLHNAGNAAGGR